MIRLNRSLVRFIALMGSLLIMAALFTFILKQQTYSGKQIDLQRIDQAILSWGGIDEPQPILQDLQVLTHRVPSSGGALSLLKRYRSLALKAQNEGLTVQLHNMYAQRAAEFYKLFPERKELLLLYLDSLYLVPRPLSDAEKELLKNINLRSVSEQNAELLMLVLQKAHMVSPAHFTELPYGVVLLQKLIQIDEQKIGTLGVNEVLALALAGNFQAAIGACNKLFHTSLVAKSILAHLLYDFGLPEEGARLFYSLYKEEGKREYLLHTADAYVKAGDFSAAKSLWQHMLGDLSGPNLILALYNLGSLSDSISERQDYFARLLQIQKLHEYALVQYSRLLQREEGKALLVQSSLYAKSPLLQLETEKKDIAGTRSIYKTGSLWLVLNRFPLDERMYHWAAWYFYSIGNLQELEKLFSMAEEHTIEFPALLLYRALLSMERGHPAEAETLLAANTDKAWYIPANLAKVYETTYRIVQAIEYYQIAASQADSPVVQSRLYECIGTCYVKLDKKFEARRSYEYALQLNPNNITAAFLLQRLEASR